jgi:hypothetical protein
LKNKKILFNTFYKDSAASMFYIESMKDLPNITFFDYDNYINYDIALFMTYKNDLKELKKAKLLNPDLIIGLLDPRGSPVEGYMEYIDFLVVDSIEMKDFFAKYNLPVHTYYEYANIPMITKTHKKKEKIILGYHGNKVHLTAMFPEISSAIELLATKYNIEFWAMYNIECLGCWDVGVPKDVKIKHIQWSMENYEQYLSQIDIGLTPACMPIKKGARKKSIVSKFFNDNQDDYIIKFKMPSNPGRIIIFAKLGIPVVADFLPSNIQFIKDEENGMLAYSTGGWYKAIEKLILSHSLRQKLSDNMIDTYNKYFDYKQQNIKFIDFIGSVKIRSYKNKISNDKKLIIENIKFNNVFIYNKIKSVLMIK